MNNTIGWLLLLAAICACPVPRVRAPLPLGGQLPMAAPDRSVRLDLLGAGVGAVAVLLIVPLPWGIPVALATAWVAWWRLPRELSRRAERDALARARALPDAIDLLAAVLRAGLPDTAAVELVASVSPPVLARPLSLVARHRTLGAASAVAWRHVVAEPGLTDLALAMIRHSETGSPIAAVLDRVAADARRDYFAQAQAAARAAAVRAVIPLAVCFLPAFVLVGVVPIVAALVGDLSFLG